MDAAGIKLGPLSIGWHGLLIVRAIFLSHFLGLWSSLTPHSPLLTPVMT